MVILAEPVATKEPEKTLALVCLSTGKDSPVKEDSLILKF